MIHITTMLVRTFLIQKTCGESTFAADHDPVGPGRTARNARLTNAKLSFGLPPYQAMKNSVAYAKPTIAARGQDDLVHVLEVVQRDDVFQPEPLAGRDQQRAHHREAREHGAGDEVGREDRRVPAGQLRGSRSQTTRTECTESTSGVASPASSRYAFS